jgi:hypothetical protein
VSYRVVHEVLERSVAKPGPRFTLTAIAEDAWHDGVAWIEQGWPTKDSPQPSRDTIAGRTGNRAETVARHVADLEGLDELEVREVIEFGDRRLVYRVIVGAIRCLEVQYAHHRLEARRRVMPVRFWTPEQLLLPRAQRPDNSSGRLARIAAIRASILTRGTPERAPDGSSGADLTDAQVPPDELSVRDLTDSRGPARASGQGSTSFPGVRAAAAVETDAAAALLEAALKELGVPRSLRRRALADPKRAAAWLELAQREAARNPGGFFRSGFETGDYPSPRRGAGDGRAGSMEAWIDNNSWRLEEAADAHMIVDDWTGIDDAQRSLYHERVDRVRSERLDEPGTEKVA